MFKKLKDELQRNINSSSSPPPTGTIFYSRLERIPKYNEVCHGNFVPSKGHHQRRDRRTIYH